MDTLTEKNDPNLMQQIEQNLLERKTLAEEYGQLLLTSRFERELGLKYTPTLLGKLYVFEEFEQRRNYTRALFGQLRGKGWELEIGSDQIKPYEPLKILWNELKEQKKVDAETMFDEIKDGNVEEIARRCNERVKKNEGKQTTKLRMETANVLKHFGSKEYDYNGETRVVGSNIESFDDFKLAKKNLAIIRTIAVEGEIAMLQERMRAVSYDCADLTLNMRSMQTQKIDECLALLGVDHTDEGMFIEKGSFEREESKVVELCRKSAQARDPKGGFVVAKGTKPGAKAITALRRELYASRGMNLTKCRPTTGGDGRRTVNRYKVSVDENLARLASKSNFNTFDAASIKCELAAATLKRRFGECEDYVALLPESKRHLVVPDDVIAFDDLLTLLEQEHDA